MWENCSIIDFIGFGAHGLYQRGILKKNEARDNNLHKQK